MGMTLDCVKGAKQDRPRRIIVLGRAKAGKSTLASQAPAPIFIPIKGEEGIDALDVPAFPICNKFSDVMECLRALYDEHPYKTIVIDSISTLELLVWDETCRINEGVDSIEKVGKGFAKGYTEALRQWRFIVEALDHLRNDMHMGCVLIGHVKAKRFNDPTMEAYDRWQVDINDKAAEFLTRWADGVLFLTHKVAVKKEDAGFNKTVSKAKEINEGAPVMYTQERPAHPGGGRGNWSKLPYEMECSWAALEAGLSQ